MNDKVSIIIPVYNRKDLIAETLESVTNQTYTNWECLIIDDGSVDETESVVKTFVDNDNRFRYYKRPNNLKQGANSCRNYGLQLSTGNYINWLDSDDLFHPDKLKLQVQKLKKSNTNFAVCRSSKFKINFDDLENSSPADSIYSTIPFNDFLTKKITWLTSVPLFKKSFLVDNNYNFDEKLAAGQEWDLFTRILFKYPDYEIIDTPLCFIRVHDNQISSNSNKPKNIFNYFLARRKIYNMYKNKLNHQNKLYLERYFLLAFKRLLRLGATKYAFKVWCLSLRKDASLNLKSHILLVLAFISFALFNRGDAFLSKVHKWKV